MAMPPPRLPLPAVPAHGGEQQDAPSSGEPNKKRKTSGAPRTARQVFQDGFDLSSGADGSSCAPRAGHALVAISQKFAATLGLDCVWSQSRRGKSFATIEKQLGYIPPPQIIAVASTPGSSRSTLATSTAGPPNLAMALDNGESIIMSSAPAASNHLTSQASQTDELHDESELPPSLTRPVSNIDPLLFSNQTDPIVHDEPRRLSSLPMPGDSGNNPLHALAEASRMASGPQGGNGKDGYFRPNDGEAPRLTQESARRHKGEVEPPHVLALITKADAELLFQIYRDFLHPHLPVLCIESTTTGSVARSELVSHFGEYEHELRHHFLYLTGVPTFSSTPKPEIARALSRFGRTEMSRFPLDKSIEVVQAHLIYAHWNLMPGDRFETDATWLRIGLAVRTALDLNLHRVALVKDIILPPLLRASIIRTWLLCYYLDQVLSSQLGKPCSPLAHPSIEGYMKLVGSSADDQRVLALVKYAQLLSGMMDVLNFPSSTDLYPVSPHYPDLRASYERQFHVWAEESLNASAELVQSEHQGAMTRSQILIHAYYAKLIVNSNLLQRCLDVQHAPQFEAAFTKFQTAALQLIEVFEKDFAPRGLMKYCPDIFSTYLTYACVSLLKSTQPQFRSICTNYRDCFATVERVSKLMARGAASKGHLPYIHANFLNRLSQNRSGSRSGSPAAEGDNTGTGPENEISPMNSAPNFALEDVNSAALNMSVGNFGAPLQEGAQYFESDFFWNSVFPATSLAAEGVETTEASLADSFQFDLWSLPTQTL
ncbi:hypothetical protein OIO90_006617 [Microbotryomycetes sp. JL221]|nr:hypothetical protein OIO90_006617 [Microbotryomycetes sp. JL221]